MNEQKAPNGIEWTRVVLADGSRTRGFTWNVFGGCRHACEWVMPDGKVAECYAKTVAERLAQEHYPQGFEAHYFHPKRLVEPGRQKNPAGIFLDSMADAMGHWVEEDQIKQVLDVCRATPQHIYFLLTKNAVRLPDFDFPENVWTGASSPPDRMFGKPLNRKKQEAMLRTTMKALRTTKSKIRWMSFEPLSWDCADIIAEFPGVLQWAVIGAASDGAREYPPNLGDLVRLLTVLDEQNVPVFFKGNLRSLTWAAAHWREDFPTSPTRAPKLVDATGLNLKECLNEAHENQARAFEVAEVYPELCDMYAVYADYWYRAAARLRAVQPVQHPTPPAAAAPVDSQPVEPPPTGDYANPYDLPDNAQVVVLWQPYASLMMIPQGKQIETRSWKTNHRGTLVVHAAKRWDDELKEIANSEPFASVLRAQGLDPQNLPLGAALGTVILDNVQPVESIRDLISEQERAFGDYSDGRYGWLTSRPKPFRDPLPVAGEQGLRSWASYLQRINGAADTTNPLEIAPESVWVGKYVVVPGQDPNLVRGRVDRIQDGQAMITFNQQADWIACEDVVAHPEATTRVYTTSLHTGANEPDLIDITVKSATTPLGKFFAPTWDMVNGVKEGAITEAQYTTQYESLLRSRYSSQEVMLRNTLFEQRRIVLGCYCAPRTFCHRHIAVGLLQKIGMKFGITVVQAGELEPQPEPKPDAPPQQLSLFDMKTYA